jgi:hypothetical protein
MQWNGHRLTAALRCPVTSEAYPTIRAVFVSQTAVAWDTNRNTILAFLTKSPVAVYFLCAKPGFNVPILRRSHFFAFFSDLPEEPIAHPSISSRCKVGILRNIDFLAKLPDMLETMFAFPATAIGATRQICVFW